MPKSGTYTTMEEEKIRLFVGGLGPEVSAGDLQERFATLGNVQSVALPPAKAGFGHRGFAYVDFVPATDASLRKLFSAVGDVPVSVLSLDFQLCCFRLKCVSFQCILGSTTAASLTSERANSNSMF